MARDVMLAGTLPSLQVCSELCSHNCKKCTKYDNGTKCIILCLIQTHKPYNYYCVVVVFSMLLSLSVNEHLFLLPFLRFSVSMGTL